MEFILILLSSLLFTIPYYFPALFFLSWFAFIPLVYLIRNYDYSHSFIIALLIGFLNSIFSLYWLYRPLSSVLKMPFSFNLFILFLYFLLSALPFAFWVLLNKFLQPKYSYSPFIAALSWTVLEYLRFEFFNFNPFNYFAHTQSAFSLIVQYASYGGIFLVSFISVLIASYFVKIYLDPSWKKAVPLLLLFVILAALPFLVQPAEEEELSRHSVELLAANSVQSDNIFEKIEAEINNLSSLVENSESEIIFTPEKSISFDLIRNNYYRDLLFSKLSGSLQDTYLQLGARAAAEGSYKSETFNSLFLLSEDMEVVKRSNQQRNITAGIKFPYLKETAVFIVNYLNLDPELADLSGSSTLVEIDAFDYINLFSEEIFISRVSRKENYSGKEKLIVNSAAEEEIGARVYSNLSLAAAVYRAAESNTELIRIVSGGFSAHINERGKIMMKKRIEGESETINLALREKQSYYQKYPDRIINILISIFLLVFLIKITVIIKNKWSSRN